MANQSMECTAFQRKILNFAVQILIKTLECLSIEDLKLCSLKCYNLVDILGWPYIINHT